MTDRITFSVASPESALEGVAPFQQLISPELESDIALSVAPVKWEQLWHFIQTKALPRTDVDVSEVGSTWLGSLSDINALRPFSEREIAGLGGPAVFSDAAWTSNLPSGKAPILSIPWLTDVRVIYYWRDVLSSQGLDEELAFSTPQESLRTIMILHRAGLPTWGTPTHYCMNTVHNVASWLWAGRKDFVSRDGTRTEFCDEGAIRNIALFFEMSQYMRGTYDSLSKLSHSFVEKEVAAVMDGPWLLRQLMKHTADPNAVSNVGVALPPGPPFLGGSSLVIWSGIEDRRAEAALKLIRHLVSETVQSRVTQATGHLPVLVELMKRAPYTSDPRYKMLIKAERAGRRPPNSTIWGQLENSLTNACFSIWQRIKDRGSADMTDIVRRQLEPIATRFDRLLHLFGGSGGQYFSPQRTSSIPCQDPS